MTGKEIADIRKSLGMTQTRFSLLFGAHSMTVSKWERETSKPTAHQTALIEAFWTAREKDESVGKMANLAISQHGADKDAG